MLQLIAFLAIAAAVLGVLLALGRLESPAAEETPPPGDW